MQKNEKELLKDCKENGYEAGLQVEQLASRITWLTIAQCILTARKQCTL